MDKPAESERDHAFADRATAALVAQLQVAAGRAAGLIDRTVGSETYGCADRAYWYYRTLTNFPGATWQQVMLGFAALYAADHAANGMHHHPDMLRLAEAALGGWIRSQKPNGAHDEWYLNEQSFCPTAITSAGAALTLKLLAGDLPHDLAHGGLETLTRAGDWLKDRYNPTVMNQNLAAAAALQGLATLSDEAVWQDEADALLARVQAEQSAEGWLPEYGGADLGYSTLALDFLAAGDLLGERGRARAIAAGLIGFLSEIQGSGPLMPGRLGSRGTAHQFPFGALHFARTDARAATLAHRWLEAFQNGFGPCPAATDDRYFSYFVFPQLALALIPLANPPDLEAAGTLTAESASVTDLPESGFHVTRRPAWSATVSRRLGGAVAVEAAGRAPRYHLGYVVEMADGRLYASAAWDETSPVHKAGDGEPISIVAPFKAVSAGLPLKRLMIPFQVAVHLLRSGRLADAFQKTIKRRMVAPRRVIALRLEREVEIGGDVLAVRDTLIADPSLGAIRAVRLASQITMHSPSARQDRGDAMGLPATCLAALPARLNSGKTAGLTWSWAPGKDVPDVVVHEDAE